MIETTPVLLNLKPVPTVPRKTVWPALRCEKCKVKQRRVNKEQQESLTGELKPDIRDYRIGGKVHWWCWSCANGQLAKRQSGTVALAKAIRYPDQPVVSRTVEVDEDGVKRTILHYDYEPELAEHLMPFQMAELAPSGPGEDGEPLTHTPHHLLVNWIALTELRKDGTPRILIDQMMAEQMMAEEHPGLHRIWIHAKYMRDPDVASKLDMSLRTTQRRIADAVEFLRRRVNFGKIQRPAFPR